MHSAAWSQAEPRSRDGAKVGREEFLTTENTEDTENSFWILEFGFWIDFFRGFVSLW
jgi:hypothetical protein